MIANAKAWEQLTDADLVHLQDIQFVAYCFQTYGLNRGIYNTIDQWLYDSGYRDVLERRKATVTFLSLLSEKGGKERSGSLLRFGKGGVTKQLYDFIHLPETVFVSQRLAAE